MSETALLEDQEPKPAPTQEPAQTRKSLFANMYEGGKKTKLAKFFEVNQDTYKKILMFIEQGCYDYVAAEAMGITADTWYKWLRIGEEQYRDGRRSYYARFFVDVRTAQSRSRLLAEIEVKREDPRFWLTRGPGKSRPGRPGWTETVHIGGDEGAPLEVRGQENVTPSSIGDLAATLVVMEQLGFIQLTNPGMSVVVASQHAPATFEGKAITVPLNAPEEDDDDLSSDSVKGYAPELETRHKGNGHE